MDRCYPRAYVSTVSTVSTFSNSAYPSKAPPREPLTPCGDPPMAGAVVLPQLCMSAQCGVRPSKRSVECTRQTHPTDVLSNAHSNAILPTHTRRIPTLGKFKLFLLELWVEPLPTQLSPPADHLWSHQIPGPLGERPMPCCDSRQCTAMTLPHIVRGRSMPFCDTHPCTAVTLFPHQMFHTKRVSQQCIEC